MDAWVIWTVLAVGFAVGELLTLSLFIAPFSVGGFGAAAVAAAGGGLAPQVAVFAVLTVGVFWLLRPIAKRHLRQTSETKTGTAALVGRTAIVTAALDGPELTGQVRLDGETWTARGAGLEAVPVGTTVTVLEIRGATAVVTD
jgi:membrane protein implicated in regulation of membrane protease activity